MVRRASLACLALIAATALPVGLALDAGAVRQPEPRGAAPAPAGATTRLSHGDLDGDHVDDAFAGRLGAAAATARLRVIVTGLSSQASQRAVGTFQLRRQLPIIRGYAATMSAAQARALARQPGVRRVEADGVMRILDDSGRHDFGADAARADRAGLDGSGIGVCIIDTGVDPQHEQFDSHPITFQDFVGTATTSYDDQGHGSHVASIAVGDGTGGALAARFGGVAPAADLFVAKVMDSSGYGNDSDIIAGITWCHDQPGVRVLSMSIGDDAVGSRGDDAVSVAVNNVVGLGEVVVAAAGNSGDLPGTVHAPGASTGAITVGAVSDYSAPVGTYRHDDGIFLASFSSRGPTDDGRIKPDISAPGVTVGGAQKGTVGSYIHYDGTSMATPYVSGAIALALEANPSATPEQVRAAVEGTALDVGAPGKDNEYGAGYVDVRALVDAIVGVTPRATDFPVQTHLTGAVADHGSVTIPIEVPSDGLGVPLAVSMTIVGTPLCYYGCLIVEWRPDLDMELRAPNGSVVATSTCPADGLQCGVGRGETVGFMPGVAGTWTLRIWTDEGTNNAGRGGSYALDISHGPVGSLTPPPPPPSNNPPVANAGPDQDLKTKGKTASIVLNGSGSDPDGDPLTYAWRDADGNLLGSTARITVKRGVGTWTFTLTVSDGRGGTGSDSVRVVVHR